jgi:hypothetical protein
LPLEVLDLLGNLVEGTVADAAIGELDFEFMAIERGFKRGDARL